MGQPLFSARIERQLDIPEFLFALNAFLAQHCADDGLAQRGSVVIEELVVNAFWHGAAEGAGGVEVDLAVERPGLRGSIRHGGSPFDPTTSPLDQSEARTGGRGLRLIQGLTSALFYSRVVGANVVRFELSSA